MFWEVGISPPSPVEVEVHSSDPEDRSREENGDKERKCMK